MSSRDPVAAVLDGLALRAGSFIVTVYGDVVVPRGGVLWTGSLIDICARVGISETLVRTAVSRLVAARRLAGERVGRRSYYRLDLAARDEFARAAALLYAPDPAPRGWQVLHAPTLSDDEARDLRLGRIAPGVFLRPDRGEPAPPGAVLFRAADPDPPADPGRYWNLLELQARYLDMMARFSGIETAASTMSDETALVVRLLLVEVWRHVLLRDPRLPDAALPRDWKGAEARALFVRLYRALTPAAERHIATRFEGPAGPLPARTEESDLRLPRAANAGQATSPSRCGTE